jgi:uncharacterized protein YeaO (DUF488 family)
VRTAEVEAGQRAVRSCCDYPQRAGTTLRTRAGFADRKEAHLEIRLKRAYEAASPEDGQRILVERLWPRGVSKERADLSAWLKEVAPSPELRVWYGHELARWPEFHRRYCAELRTREATVTALDELRALLKRGRTTFIYAAHDELHNSALALKEFLEGGA